MLYEGLGIRLALHRHHFKDGESNTKVTICAHDAIRMMHLLPDTQSRVSWSGGSEETTYIRCLHIKIQHAGPDFGSKGPNIELKVTMQCLEAARCSRSSCDGIALSLVTVVTFQRFSLHFQLFCPYNTDSAFQKVGSIDIVFVCFRHMSYLIAQVPIRAILSGQRHG
jgi:hypothetical protein